MKIGKNKNKNRGRRQGEYPSSAGITRAPITMRSRHSGNTNGTQRDSNLGDSPGKEEERNQTKKRKEKPNTITSPEVRQLVF